MPTFPNSILFQLSGTLINVATILIGSLLGIWFGRRVPERARHTVISGMGLFTAAIGLQMFLEHSINALIVLGSLLAGALLGEWWRIEDRLAHLGAILEQRFARPSDTAGHENRFVKGFLTASLLFCIGPIAIIGSIQNGLSGDYQLLAIKAVLDGFASLAFASTLGIGVMFSSLIILVYQGGLSLLAAQMQVLTQNPPMMNALTATGGVILLGIAISSLLEIKPIRMGNFLPALAIAPLIVAVLAALGINV